jgi:hypothetical protein
MNQMKVVCLVFMFCLCASKRAYGVEGPPRSKGVEACRKDIRRFCKDVAPGEGRVGLCLYEHFKELSKTCRRFSRHGGPGHEMESLKDIDKSLLSAPKP